RVTVPRLPRVPAYGRSAQASRNVSSVVWTEPASVVQAKSDHGTLTGTRRKTCPGQAICPSRLRGLGSAGPCSARIGEDLRALLAFDQRVARAVRTLLAERPMFKFSWLSLTAVGFGVVVAGCGGPKRAQVRTEPMGLL